METFIKFWSLCQIFVEVSSEINFRFIRELTSHYIFYSPVYNLILCNERDSIDLIKMLSEKFESFIVVHSSDKDLNSFLDESQTFLLDLQCPRAGAILKQAEDLSLYTKPFRWILLNDDEVSVASNSSHPSENGKSWIWSFLETLSLLVDSDVKVIEKSLGEKITVEGVYKSSNVLKKELLFRWTPKEGLIVLNSKSVAIRRWNLQGVTIPSSIVCFPEGFAGDPAHLLHITLILCLISDMPRPYICISWPYIISTRENENCCSQKVTQLDSLEHLDDLIDKHIDTTTKVSYNMVRIFSDLFNASINYKIQKEWGVLINGSWTGMVGDLERKEIEIGAAPLFLQTERMRFVEYFASVTPTRVKFIFLSPPLSYSSNIFAMPFDTIVWGCCLAMVIGSCFLLFTALNYEKSHFNMKEKRKEKVDSKISFTEILVLNIGAICLQGTFAPTKHPPGRIITLFLYLAYMFLYISYSASIVAILQSSDTSIQTLSDFLKSPLKAGADEVAYSQYYFKRPDDDVRKAIYRTKIAPKNEAPHFLPVEEGIKKVRKGFYGFHVEVSVGYQVIQKTFNEEEKCALQELKDSYFRFSDPWLVMKKKTPYAELFKIGMKMCIEKGFKSRFVRRYYTKKPVCTSKSSRFVSVGIFDCYYAFVLLITGLTAAFMIMLLEISFSKYLKKLEDRRLDLNNDFTPGFEFYN